MSELTGHVEVASHKHREAIERQIAALEYFNLTVSKGGKCDVNEWHTCQQTANWTAPKEATFLYSAGHASLSTDFMFSAWNLTGVWEVGRYQFGQQSAYRLKNWNLIKDKLVSDIMLPAWQPLLEQSPVLLVTPDPQTVNEDEIHTVMISPLYIPYISLHLPTSPWCTRMRSTL